MAFIYIAIQLFNSLHCFRFDPCLSFRHIDHQSKTSPTGIENTNPILNYRKFSHKYHHDSLLDESMLDPLLMLCSVLFLHGIGVGLYPYTNFLRDINAASGEDADVGIIAIEIMTVSSRLTRQAFDKDVVVNEIEAIIKHHGWTKYVLVGHSYGTVICTHLLKSETAAPSIGPIVFIDPICFLLHLPDVAFNFTVRQPVHVTEHVLWYFGSKDIGVAHTLARRFFWQENILWKEDLMADGKNGIKQRHVTVVLSGRDAIVDVQAVRRYLTVPSMTASPKKNAVVLDTKDISRRSIREDEGAVEITSWDGLRLEVIWFNHFHHGGAFNYKRARNTIVKAIRDN